MTSSSKIPMAAGLLLLLVAAALYVAWGPSGTGPSGPRPGADARPGPQTAPNGAGESRPAAASVDGQVTAPKIGDQRERADPLTDGNAPQGITGMLLSPDGAPLSGVPIYLLESPLNNLIERLQAKQRSVVLPPSVRTVTDAEGRFALGVRAVAQDRSFEVRIPHNVFADHSTPGIRILPRDWFDLGRIQMERGLVVRGRVTLEGTSVPVAGALVRVKPSNREDLVSVPGRERGIEVQAGTGGFYEIPNAPRNQLVDIAVTAPGFARETRTSLTLESDQVNVLDFALPRGTSITGRTVDSRGRGIAQASIKGHCMNPKANHSETAHTGDDGWFELTGLRPDKYQLIVEAEGYQIQQYGPVAGSTTDVVVTLERKGAAGVRVVAPDGDLVSDYRLAVRRQFAQLGQLGVVRGIGPRRIVPRDLVEVGGTDGVALVQGLDSGIYVFEVQARGYAKSFSPAVEVVSDTAPSVVTLPLHRGANLAGRVTDAAGQPLQGATVRTQANGHFDNPLIKALGANVPLRITQATTPTNRDGVYALPHMAAGDYQLTISHPEACTQVLADISVGPDVALTGGSVQVPDTALPKGVQLHGIARLAGTPTGQLKVVLTAEVAPNNGSTASTQGFTAEAISDNLGRFAFGERVPPGSYEIKAARQNSGDLFTPMIDFKNSAHPLVVGADTTTLSIDVLIPAQ